MLLSRGVWGRCIGMGDVVREVDRKKKNCTFVFEMAISEIAVSELRV